MIKRNQLRAPATLTYNTPPTPGRVGSRTGVDTMWNRNNLEFHFAAVTIITRLSWINYGVLISFRLSACVSTKTLQVTLLYITHYTKTHSNIIHSCTSTYPRNKLYTSCIVIQIQHALTISKYMLHVQPVLLNLDKENLKLCRYVTPTY
jgi:hypothetical protein